MGKEFCPGFGSRLRRKRGKTSPGGKMGQAKRIGGLRERNGKGNKKEKLK
jgi:hypothetical protein